MQTNTSAPHPTRRCWISSLLLFAGLAAITAGLWHTSHQLITQRLNDAIHFNSTQVVIQLSKYIEDRLRALRVIGHYYSHSESVSERDFQAFCSFITADTPGILAVAVTDSKGVPIWLAPPNALSAYELFSLTGDPKLKMAIDRAAVARQPSVTESLYIPRHGQGFLVATPISEGPGRHPGFIVGFFYYQELLEYVLQPEVIKHYQVSIRHGNQLVFPALDSSPVNKELGLRSALDAQPILLGGQRWDVSITPIESPSLPLTDFTSITILGLGMCLSLILSFLYLRWQLRAVRFESQAQDNLSRLERTGLNLTQVKSRLELIMNTVDEGIVLYDSNKVPLQANAAFLTMFKMTDNSEAMQEPGKHHETMIQLLGTESKYWSLFDALARRPELFFTDEIEVRPADPRGKYRVYARRATCVSGPDNEDLGLMVVYRDVTQLKEGNQLKDEFLSSVTHELRSPLASIKGFAETIQRNPQMPTETRSEFVAIIQEEATRLQQLVDELLDLRRLEAQGISLKLAVYDFKTLVGDVLHSNRSVMMSKRVAHDMTWSGQAESQMVGDVTQLTRALRNLVVNAVKYSPSGATIHMHGHCGHHQLWIEITNQGTGINDKDLPFIFDKFYRGSTKGFQKGTGLGLAIVKHIVEMHGGHLGVRSEPGVGTTFRMELPRNYKFAAGLQMPAASPAQPQEQNADGQPLQQDPSVATSTHAES